VSTESVVKALEDSGVETGVDPDRLSQARRLLDSFLGSERRTVPDGGSRACLTCRHYTGEICCGLQAENR
jgi:hypothetical protein